MVDSVSDLMQRATAHHTRGELEVALGLYKLVLEHDPEHGDALHLAGVIAHQEGRNDEAVALITRAIGKNPGAPAFRNNLGMALASLGRTAEAAKAYRDALALAPNFSDALLNLGNLCAAAGRLEEAETLLERAISADPSAPQAHYGLAFAQFALGNSRGSVEALQRAVALGADFAEVHCRLGNVRVTRGEVSQAIESFGRALERESDYLGALHGLLGCLDMLPPGVESTLLESVVSPLLRSKSVNPRTIGHASARLFERKYRLGSDEASTQSSDSLCDRVLDDDILRLYLERTVNVSVPLERLLTRCRGRWLAEVHEQLAIPRARWDALGAVAIQCFINEYVWAVRSEEARTVDSLERRIVDGFRTAEPPSDVVASALLVYACYRPLWRLACAARLRAIPVEAVPAALRVALRACLHEPLRELDLGAHITSGVTIRNPVSRAVQAQYEENPYPRWSEITRGVVQSIEQRVQRWHSGYVAPAELRGPLRVLVAGCGTGADAIDMALHLERAVITAIDLSRASLAFAMRKAEEYGLENLQFRQEDILELEGSDGRYHVIVCTGVLHHMKDPGAGLERLVPLLVPGGLMKLALYSRLARAPLLQARDVIRASADGPGEVGIRVFRQRVLSDRVQGPLAELMGSTDFFSTSECRDLLFHVQEMQLTLPEVGHLLDGVGLEFLGFELAIAEVEQGFRREHPGAALTDLEAWATYEQRHPESFRSMYQFWCRKAYP